MNKPKKTLETNYVFSFILRFITIILAGFGIFGLLTITLLNKNIGPGYSKGISDLNQLKENLPFIISITAFIQAFILCAIIILLILIWSHAIAGPIARFKKILKNISAKSTLPEELIIFRDNDQLKTIAQNLSQLILTHKSNDTKALTLLIEAQEILNTGKGTEKLLKIYQQIKDIYNNYIAVQ